MPGLSFQDHRAGLPDDTIREIQADAFRDGGPEFNCNQVIVPRRGPVTKVALDDRENKAPLLPLKKRYAEVAEEFAPGRLHQVQVTSVVYMVAGRAIGIRHPMGMVEGR